MVDLSGPVALAERLIAFPTVSRDSNLDLIAHVTSLLEARAIPYRLFRNADETKANLLASFGPAERPGLLLSGHTDVVPVDGQDWSGDPFAPWISGGHLYGRGACDMKGFIGLVLDRLLRSDVQRFRAPIHLALSYDEEVGCAGVRSLVDHIAALETRPALAIVGEPTEMQVITAHKGIRVVRTAIRGRAAHSSAPDEGASAALAAAALVSFIGDVAERLARGPSDPRFDPGYTSVNVGRVEAGTAVNIIAQDALIEWEYRPMPGTDADLILNEVRAYADTVILPTLKRTAPEAEITFELAADAPALEEGPNASAEAFLRRLSGANRGAAVSFATEAGLFQSVAGVPTVVCGPGSIAQAHKPDEFVSLDQLARADRMVARLIAAAESGRIG